MPHAGKASRALDWIMPSAWLVVLGATVAAPYLLSSPALADDLTRYTVRLALVYYAAGATFMLLLRGDDWKAAAGMGRLARWCWTLAWATYLVHLYMAFHYYHHGSHAAAVRHTQAVSGFGPGIWFSHLYTLLWSLDVVTWWLKPEGYAARSPWIDRLLHGFMAFINFNATVVYEQGPIRWAGIFLFCELAVVWLYRLRAMKSYPVLPG